MNPTRFGVLLAAVIFWASPAFCGQITFEGKTFSPNAREVYTPHAPAPEIKANESLKLDMKQRGEDPDSLPPLFTGTTKIVKLFADVGQKVQESTVIFEYSLPANIREFEMERINHGGVDSLEHSLMAVRAVLNDRREFYNELRFKFTKGLATQEELTLAQRTIEAMKLKEASLLEMLKSEKEQLVARTDVANSKYGAKEQEASAFPKTGRMYAMNNGYILWKNPELKAGATFSKYTRLFRIGELEHLTIKAWVPEKYINDVHENDPVDIIFESLPGQKFTGKVSRVAVVQENTESQLANTFVIEIDVPNEKLTLKEGMRAILTMNVPDQP